MPPPGEITGRRFSCAPHRLPWVVLPVNTTPAIRNVGRTVVFALCSGALSGLCSPSNRHPRSGMWGEPSCSPSAPALTVRAGAQAPCALRRKVSGWTRRGHAVVKGVWYLWVVDRSPVVCYCETKMPSGPAVTTVALPGGAPYPALLAGRKRCLWCVVRVTGESQLLRVCRCPHSCAASRGGRACSVPAGPCCGDNVPTSVRRRWCRRGNVPCYDRRGHVHRAAGRDRRSRCAGKRLCRQRNVL